MKKVFKIIGLIVLALVVLVFAFIGILTLTEYKPADEEIVEIADSNSTQESIHAGDSLRVVTWNIGYGALGDNADFFMDGGKGVQTADLQRTQENINSMIEGLQQLKPDVLFLQEVDIQSDRSHHLNEVEAFRAAFTDMSSTYAPNYKVLFVPYPIPPIGHVDGGIVTFSRFPIASSQRIQLPCPFSWPVRLGNLKRCLLVSRIPVEGTDKELVAVNLHLEAYDDGEGKIAQTQQLASFLQAEAGKGNYVIAGGDFNQLFPSADDGSYAVKEGLWTPGVIDEKEFEGHFVLLMDQQVPTCRSLDQPYAGADPDTFQYYMIDGFIISDNLSVQILETQDYGFTASDHNPVLLELTLKEN